MRTYKDISYGMTEHPARKMDIYLPDSGENFPVFVYYHGGGIEGGDKIWAEPLVSYLVPHGVAVVSANYRMYPEAVFPEFIRDAAACAAWVKEHIAEYGGDPDKIFLGGSSAGGYISMMLCYDRKWLAPYHLTGMDFAGWIHDAGQPTTHYNVCRERGLDGRRVIIDEAAPIYYIGLEEEYKPQLIIVSDNDMQNRPEQTTLTVSTLNHFDYDMSKVKKILMHGGHCEYDDKYDENGDSIFGKMIFEFMKEYC